MKRLHVMLKVDDLEGSVDFYRTLFAAEPTVRRDDYAKWMLDDPRVNFSVGVADCCSDCQCEGTDCDCSAAPGIEHLGIQAETPDELTDLRGRVSALADRASVRDEGETACCYARSDKTWITDGQGVSWEMFHTHGTSEPYGNEPVGQACC